MSKVLNTPYEISIRVLLILEAIPNYAITIDMLAATDFITVNCKEFEIFEFNLHGDNIFKFSEFTLRRDIVKLAIKMLLLDGLLTLSQSESGFAYTLSESGLDYIKKITCNYANEYRTVIKKTLNYINNKTEQQILQIINKLSIRSLQTDEVYE